MLSALRAARAPARRAVRAPARQNHRFALEPNPERVKAMLSTAEHTQEHAVKTTSLWKNISIATVPVLLICAYYVYGTESHHLEHLWHVHNVPDEEWPAEMEYQNIRSKKFFWSDGDKTAFWSWANHHKGHSEN